MKKRVVTLTTAAIISGVLFSSCIGSFSLSNKLLAWNQTIDNKFVNEVVFVALWIVPVYEISMLADILVLNSIEFWSGENPVQAGIVKQVQGENAIYTVETLENGYHIENEKGDEMNLVYDKATNTWSATTDKESVKLVTIVDEDHAIVYLPNGNTMPVDLSANGVLALRQAVEGSSAFLATK